MYKPWKITNPTLNPDEVDFSDYVKVPEPQETKEIIKPKLTQQTLF